MSKRDTPGPGSYMPPSDFGYLELYKYSPRTSHGQRSQMDTMCNTISKFSTGRGQSQMSTRQGTTQKSRNAAQGEYNVNSIISNGAMSENITPRPNYYKTHEENLIAKPKKLNSNRQD